MKAFAYGRDPLSLAAMGLYALNRWVLKPAGSGGFWHNHFNDLLLIPAALPLVLWIQRRLGLRNHDRPPTTAEIALHLVVWTVVCEIAGPRLSSHGTADPRDAAAYAAGAVFAWGWWSWPGYWSRRTHP